MEQTLIHRAKSSACYRRACDLIPGGVNSPIRAFKGLGLDPLVIDSGEGDTLIDLDGNRYIDFCCSWGALIHGHAHPAIVDATIKRMRKGSSFGLLTAEEEILAKELLSHVPADKVRFVSSGTEATMTALRLARGYTGRERIIKFSGHYHGHVDALLVQAGSGCLALGATASSAGVPRSCAELTSCIPFNNIPALIAALDQSNVAALILEPVAANMGVVEPLPGFLEQARYETAKRGILLIFDEVITGFRLGLGGAAGYFKIAPDLMTFGKVIGGGYPVAAVAGKKEIMDCLAPIGAVYQAGTLSGNPVAMAAGIQSIKLAQQPLFYEKLEAKTKQITEPVKALIERRGLQATCHQIGSLFTLFLGQREVYTVDDTKRCDTQWYQQLFHFLFNRGIYFSPLQCEANFVSTAHTQEHIELTRDAILEFLDR